MTVRSNFGSSHSASSHLASFDSVSNIAAAMKTMKAMKEGKVTKATKTLREMKATKAMKLKKSMKAMKTIKAMKTTKAMQTRVKVVLQDLEPETKIWADYELLFPPYSHFLRTLYNRRRALLPLCDIR